MLAFVCAKVMLARGYDLIIGLRLGHGNIAKCQRHGVPVEAIESVFAGTLSVGPDPAHSTVETRFRAIGKSMNGRYVFLVFTLRGPAGAQLIRPISARYMHAKEVRHDEQQS